MFPDYILVDKIWRRFSKRIYYLSFHIITCILKLHCYAVLKSEGILIIFIVLKYFNWICLLDFEFGKNVKFENLTFGEVNILRLRTHSNKTYFYKDHHFKYFVDLPLSSNL